MAKLRYVTLEQQLVEKDKQIKKLKVENKCLWEEHKQAGEKLDLLNLRIRQALKGGKE